MTRKVLMRSEENKILGGVCGGIAVYFDVDPVLIRLGWVFLTLAGGGGVLVYLIAWIIIPSRAKLMPEENGEMPEAEDMTENMRKVMQEGRPSQGILSSGRHSAAIGMLILILGIALLLNNLDFWSVFGEFRWWPGLLILAGLILIFKDRRQQK